MYIHIALCSMILSFCLVSSYTGFVALCRIIHMYIPESHAFVFEGGGIMFRLRKSKKEGLGEREAKVLSIGIFTGCKRTAW